MNDQVNPDDFPDSPYADELRRGLSGLRFRHGLEAEYTLSHLRRVLLRVRIWSCVTLMLVTLFTVAEVLTMGPWGTVPLLRFGAPIPFAAALAWLSWTRHYTRFYLPAASILIPLLSALVAIGIALALSVGQGELLAGLTVDLIGIFFFTGLLFRRALLASVVTIVVFATAEITVGLSPMMLATSLVAASLTGLIAAVVYRDSERSYRQNFLEAALINDLVARDGLSGLLNRRAFDLHLRRVWQLALTDHRSVAVFMVDIDDFKRFNDEFGHQVGDLVLRSVAQAVKLVAQRPLDVAARYGGEEFAVVLYDLPPTHLYAAAERLRDSMQSLTINGQPLDEAIGAAITVSVGVGMAQPTIGRRPEGAVQLADEALYLAKMSGRNCVVVKGADAYRLLETGKFNARPKQGSPSP